MRALVWVLLGVLYAMPATTWAAAQPLQVLGRTLLARVVDGAGRTQVDLGIDDFVVSEAGEPREVLDVHVADYPVAILVDDAVEETTLEVIKAAVARFINRVGDRPTAISLLSRPTEPVVSFADPRPQVLAAVTELSVSTVPADPLRAVATLASLISETGAPFSAVVVVAGHVVDATRQVDGQLLPSILESGATVHVIGHRDARADPTGGTPDLLEVLADQTRGQYTTIYTTASFAIALDRLADRLSTELMVGYLVPPDGTSGDVRIGVRRPGSQVVGLGVR